MKTLISIIFLAFVFSSCQKLPAHGSSYHWTPYSKQAIADSITQHKPVVIDFFAEWCPNCHELDAAVFSLPDIQAKLAQFTTLRMDVTNQDDPKIQQMLQDYGIEGVPTVIFLDSKGQEIKDSRVIGFVTPKEFSQALAMLTIFK